MMEVSVSEDVFVLGRSGGRLRSTVSKRWTMTHRRRHLSLYSVASARRRRFIGLLGGRVVTSSSSAEIAGAGLIRLSMQLSTEAPDVG